MFKIVFFVAAVTVGGSAAWAGFTSSATRVTNIEVSKTRQDLPITCNDPSLRPFWAVLSKHDFFRGGTVASRQIVRTKPDNSSEDCTHYFKVSEQVDLDHDGKMEVIIEGKGQGFCDISANCNRFIFHDDGGRYRLILYSPVSIEYKIGKQKTNGFQDIDFSTNDELGEKITWVYKSDGREYRLNASLRVTSKTFQDGDLKEVNPAKVDRVSCVDHPPGEMRDIYCSDL